MDFCVKYNNPFVAAIFKVNLLEEPPASVELPKVTFASSASAAALIAEAGNNFGDRGFGMKMCIDNSENIGKRKADELPDYGMYLKTLSNKSFKATSVKLSGGTNLKVTYTDGETGQYVVVHAFEEDNLKAKTASYVAAIKIPENNNGEVIINVSGWEIDSLDDCTIQIWMEEPCDSANLTKATIPETFLGIYGSRILDKNDIERKGKKEAINLRAFAMRNELKCSWGDLSNFSQESLSKIVEGKAEIATGRAATNQKIYFGTYTDENGVTRPLQFWIAGREALNGSLDSTGDIMCFYQAKGVEQMAFNKE